MFCISFQDYHQKAFAKKKREPHNVFDLVRLLLGLFAYPFDVC